MSCCHASVPQEVRPGTARVLVTELSGSGHINPTPATKPCDDSETAVEPYLSPEKLVGLHKCPRETVSVHPTDAPFFIYSLVVVWCMWLVYVHKRLPSSKPVLSEIPVILMYSCGRGIYED